MKFTSYESEVHKRLAAKINGMMRANADNLANGNCRVAGDASATAMGYSHAVGYRQALCDALAWLDEIEDDLMKE